MKSVTFDNGRGFALGFDEAAPSPFVTWQFTETENGQKDYYWGHYHSSGQTAEKDFAKRVADYKELFGVHERTEGHEQAEYYRYYSTQRPVDLGTFPKPPGNPDRAARPSITAQLKEAARRAEPPKEPDKAKHNKSREDR